jgi:hypothetical protein
MFREPERVPDELLTPDMAASFMDVYRSTILQHISSGKLAATRDRKVSLHDLCAFIDEKQLKNQKEYRGRLSDQPPPDYLAEPDNWAAITAEEAAEPTAAKCGSDRKMAIMSARIKYGLEIFHPQDSHSRLAWVDSLKAEGAL